MDRELCPRCGQPQNMTVSTSRRTVVGPDGNERDVLTRTLHCDACHAFVRAEDVAAPAVDAPAGPGEAEGA
jgi:hypothetical protein